MPRFHIAWTFILWLPASGILAWGQHLDSVEWTAEHGFLSNILASATSGLFGLPIAAVIVQLILRRDAESRRRKAIVRAARRNFAAMRSSMESMGIDKIRRIQEPVAAGARDLSVLNFAAQYSGKIPQEMADRIHPILSKLPSLISSNLPNMAQEEWRFLTALRRWDVLEKTVFSPAEVDEIQVLSDEEHASLADNVKIVAEAPINRLPDVMRDLESMAKILAETDEMPLGPPVQQFIHRLHETLTRLDSQIRARVELYASVIAAHKSVEDMSTN